MNLLVLNFPLRPRVRLPLGASALPLGAFLFSPIRRKKPSASSPRPQRPVHARLPPPRPLTTHPRPPLPPVHRLLPHALHPRPLPPIHRLLPPTRAVRSSHPKPMPRRSRSNRNPSCRRSHHDGPTPRHRRNCRKRFEGGEGGRCRVGIDGAKVAAEPRALQAPFSPFAIPQHPAPVSPAPFFPQGVAAAPVHTTYVSSGTPQLQWNGKSGALTSSLAAATSSSLATTPSPFAVHKGRPCLARAGHTRAAVTR
jgi:hypothetical protein